MIITPAFDEKDQRTWQSLYLQLNPKRHVQMTVEFERGLEALGINQEKIPDLKEVNRRLAAITGWQGVYTDGFVEAVDFFKMLSEKKFPIGNFIRNPKDLSYTPAPDVFHDLYGHMPFYANAEYSEFCTNFGTTALKYSDIPGAIEEFQRLFWFTIEFALVDTPAGIRIFGAGIASSFSECNYALSGQPRVHPFNLEIIRNKDFRIDAIQEDLFLLESPSQLYSCLSEFEKKYTKGA